MEARYLGVGRSGEQAEQKVEVPASRPVSSKRDPSQVADTKCGTSAKIVRGSGLLGNRVSR